MWNSQLHIHRLHFGQHQLETVSAFGEHMTLNKMSKHIDAAQLTLKECSRTHFSSSCCIVTPESQCQLFLIFLGLSGSTEWRRARLCSSRTESSQQNKTKQSRVSLWINGWSSIADHSPACVSVQVVETLLCFCPLAVKQPVAGVLIKGRPPTPPPTPRFYTTAPSQSPMVTRLFEKQLEKRREAAHKNTVWRWKD